MKRDLNPVGNCHIKSRIEQEAEANKYSSWHINPVEDENIAKDKKVIPDPLSWVLNVNGVGNG